MSEGIIFVEVTGKILYLNEFAEKILQKTGCKGNRFHDFFSDDHFGFSLRESLRYGICHHQLIRGPLEISSWFCHEDPKGLIIRIKDLSEKQKILETTQRFERMRELGEMSAKLAHEIRNSLGGIRGFSTLLHRDLKNEPHLQDLVTKVLDGTKSIEKLVTSVLVYAKQETVVLHTQDLTSFLKQVFKTIKIDPMVPPNVALKAYIPAETILASFDSEALKRALLNLLINSIQAVGDKGEVTLSLFMQANCCLITIGDNGAGMSQETLSSLFSLGFTTKKNGNGLGLVEVKKIVQAHGGTVEVRSMLGKGSTFIVSLKGVSK